MKKQYIILLIIFLLNVNWIYAEKRLDVDIKIISHEISDASVVGDSFYYIINFTNNGNDIIEDNFKMSIFNPRREEIGNVKEEKLVINVGETKIIKALGGKENETAIFPFDTMGDYQVNIISNNPLDFYRWFILEERTELPQENKVIIKTSKKYIRQNQNFKFNFDVMPRWQYKLWKESEKSNQKIQEANQKLIDLTVDINTATQQMNEATKKVKYATYVMLFISFLTLYVAMKKRNQ